MSLAFILGQKNLTYDPTGVAGLYERHEPVRAAYDRAAQWTGVDAGLLLRPDGDPAHRSRNTSIGLAAAMFGIADLLGEHGIHPAMIGGISLGAMVSGALCGAVSRQDVIGLLAHTDGDQRPDRAELPEGCVAAVLPLGQTYESFYGTRPGIWFGGDFGMHTSGAFRMLLLSGYREALDQLASGYPPEYFVISDETVAVHSPLRYRARDVLARIAADIAFTDPAVPMCSSLEPRVLHSADQVRSEFSRNVVEPVRADHLTGQMRRLGARLGVILGPTLPRDGFEFPFPVVYVDAPDDIGQVVAAVREHDVLLPT